MASNLANTKTHNFELRQFTLDFFASFGAAVTPQGHKQDSPFLIQLTPELATHFGKPQLQLCFQQADVSASQDLVTQGSRIFDRMLTYLDQRGALTLQRLPSRFAGGEELLKAVRPVNAGIAGLRMQEQMQHLLAFNWRITYRADDKREEMYTVVLDESGARLPQPGDANAPADALIDIAQLLADAEPVPPERNEEGQFLPPRLPPMTQLTRLAGTARKYAIYHADLRCVSHEAKILPRLYKALNRLTTYYQQQMEETYDAHDPTGEKRQAFETDLQRKINEEVENHRLRVDVKLISYAVIQVPLAVADLTLIDGKRETAVRVRRNRYNGALRRPLCHACDQETTAIAIDRNGHVTCDNCIEQCTTCQEIVCTRCGVAPCPVCGQGNCDTCGRICWACGERACAGHSSPCPICSDEVCHTCQAECVHCGVRQCRSHLRADHVAASSGVTELICANCAVRCPGCQQYSAHSGICSTSGQRFCASCLITCAKCHQNYGPGFYQFAGDQPYCLNCLVICPTCQTLTAETTACATCGEPSCHRCGQICAVCQQAFCAQHASSAKPCDHVLCQEHGTRCYFCAISVCALCDPACGICERPFCAEHSAICAQCGCTYCGECVRRSGLCDTCATMNRTGERVNMVAEPCATHFKVAPLIRHYRWTRIGNERYLIYVGEGMFPTRMVVIVDKLGSEQKVVAVRKVRLLDVMLNSWRR